MLAMLGKKITESKRSLIHLLNKSGDAIPLIPERNIHAVCEIRTRMMSAGAASAMTWKAKIQVLRALASGFMKRQEYEYRGA